MAESRDMRAALEVSKLRVTPVEEQIILNGLSDMEKRIRGFLNEEECRGEAKEPYELN